MINSGVKDGRGRGSPRRVGWGWAVKRRGTVHRGTNLDAKSTRESRAQTCVRGTWRNEGERERRRELVPEDNKGIRAGVQEWKGRKEGMNGVRRDRDSERRRVACAFAVRVPRCPHRRRRPPLRCAASVLAGAAYVL